MCPPGSLLSEGPAVATDVRLLPQGTVIFEDISIEHFEGTVTKVIPKVPSKNQVNSHFQESHLLPHEK